MNHECSRVQAQANWQRAVNRQPGSCSDNSSSRSASLDRIVIFSKMFAIFEISTKNMNFRNVQSG